MKAKYARTIRAGIQLCRDVYIRGSRQRPNFPPRFGWANGRRYENTPSLIQRAYQREQTAMVMDGRTSPPRSGSGSSRAAR